MTGEDLFHTPDSSKGFLGPLGLLVTPLGSKAAPPGGGGGAPETEVVFPWLRQLLSC